MSTHGNPSEKVFYFRDGGLEITDLESMDASTPEAIDVSDGEYKLVFDYRGGQYRFEVRREPRSSSTFSSLKRLASRLTGSNAYAVRWREEATPETRAAFAHELRRVLGRPPEDSLDDLISEALSRCDSRGRGFIA